MAGNLGGPGFPITDYNESHLNKHRYLSCLYMYMYLSDLFIFAGSDSPGRRIRVQVQMRTGEIRPLFFLIFLTMSILP